VFDKKRKRQGKEKGKKRLKYLLISSTSFPRLFLVSSFSFPYLFPSLPNFIIGNKKEFSNRLLFA
jgi:hypothetical protein